MTQEQDPIADEAERAAMKATVDGMREVLAAQTRLVDACLQCLNLAKQGQSPLASGDPDVRDVVLTMMHMIGISAHSVLRLTEEISLHVRDAYPICRSIVEGTINVLFIVAKGPDLAQRAKRHAEQKAFRDLNRTWDVGGTAWTMSHDITLDPDQRTRLESIAAEFASRSGREKDWADESVRDKLVAIEGVFPRTAQVILTAATFGLYRQASEVVHGTYYGAMFFWGFGSRRRRLASGHDLRLVMLDHQFSVLLAAVFALTALIEGVSAYVGETGLGRQAGEQLDRIRALPTIAATLQENERDGPPS